VFADWPQSPIPNPQSPIPNPQSPINDILIVLYKLIMLYDKKLIKNIYI